MTDEEQQGSVLDSLLDLQAKLRGDDLSRRLAKVPARPDATRGGAEGGSPLHVAPDPITVRNGDVEVNEGGPPSGADRLAALSDRLQRVERDLSQAMERLRNAETRFVSEDDEPETRPPADRDRSVYRRVQELQDIASRRPDRRRR
jgi:hypothetical protein